MTATHLNRPTSETPTRRVSPLFASNEAASPIPPDDAPSDLGPDSRNDGTPPRYHALVVDQSPGLLALLCALLHGQASVATSMKEAEELARERSFDLIIVDYHLPESDGLSVLHKLRGMGTMAPAIVLTDEPRIAEFLDISFLHIGKVLIKPFTMATFQAAVQQVLRK